MKKRFLKSTAVVLVALILNLSFVGSSATAFGSTYSISGLSEYTTEPTLFTVNAGAAPREICAMHYGGKTLKSAPWVFEANPYLSQTANFEQIIRIDYCNGFYDLQHLDTVFPWSLWENIVFLDTLAKSSEVSVMLVSSVNEIGNVSIADARGKVLLSDQIAPQEMQIFSFNARARPLLAKYFISITGQNSGITSVIPLSVANKWTALIGTNTFERCSTVFWSYSHKGAPKSASRKSVRADIAGAFSRIKPYVGLEFKEVKSGSFGPGDSFITLDWNYKSVRSAAGSGGHYLDGSRTVGYVNLNPRSWWPRDEQYRGFGSRNGVPGRGWLVVHEILHSLGLGHTVQGDQIMAPVIRQARFGAGDIKGLRYLYQPRSCG